MKEIIVEYIDLIYDSLKYSTRDITVFPGDNLKGVLKYAVILLVIVIIGMLLKLPVFTHLLGVAVATLFLTVMYLAGEHKNKGVKK